ncbi:MULTISPECIES: DUF262 domain-containing protein [unclassified Lysobacter]|uniref:DUF262 domain-containing protein n=1 Tax=unclassified Lysobacter TaxID=2635362 RepID=UPI001BEC640E|nr:MULTISPECIES: DUF262 domain-containing protein [unclassified Lysobacter]MBT2746514.1 DUF262 domain-containing protein [Lysobacter sp. ISL-42]MBT2753016.1 DUF262 domain-containing protein [Lysobacter sp. ISL-50]MBT2777693.1 DUF262 domain-containing protein [Lysobacter sp. ISL-54]MBT2782464.1 DUF262 domain-containing protein [Lysobacter sp. ISL-52]
MSNAAELSALESVLEEKQFVVPHYQRGYAWKQEQWLALWNDLDNLYRLGATSHFVGMLMLRTQGSRAEVVDGQQRLTTMMILANALREAAGQKPVAYALTFLENDDIQNHFDFHALGRIGAASRISPDHVSSYAKNVKKATLFFKEQAKTLGAQNALHYLNVLLTRFQLFVLEVSDSFDIHIAFETLNNRGLQLSKMELLKNRLIYLCSVLPDEDKLTGARIKDEIHRAWRGIYIALGRIAETSMDDDTFLDAHATVFYGRLREKNWLRNKLFDSEFTTRNPSLRLQDIYDYIGSLETAALWWSHIHQPRHLPSAQQKALTQLNRAQFSNIKPLLLSAFMRAGLEHPGAVIEPAAHAELFAPILNLMIQAERFGVIVFRLLGNKSTLGKAYLDSCAQALLKPGRKDPSDLPGLSAMDSAPAIDYIADYLHAWATNKNTNASRQDPRFDWTGAFSKFDLATTQIEQRFSQHNGGGYYGWQFTRLALFNYEEAFRRNGNAPVKLSWEDFSFDETVEHIFPKAAEAKDDWNQAIPIDGRFNRNDKLRKALGNSIGNLLFLSRSDNSSASNNPYVGPTGKKERYAKNGYSAAQVARVFKKWDTLTIAARGVAILKKCEERWDFELVENSDRYMNYLPLVFGAQHEAISDGKAGRPISERSLKPLVDELLADFQR